MTGTSPRFACRKTDPYTLISAANLLLPYAKAQRTTDSHSDLQRLHSLVSFSFTCLSFLQPRCTMTLAQVESLKKEAWTEVTSS